MAELLKWPKWMRVPTVDSYAVEIVDRRVVTEMEIGSVTRVEFNTDETVANCSLFCNPMQSDWFEAFERDVLIQGSIWYKTPLWVGGKLIEHVIRFKDRPKLTNKLGSYSTYSFKLEIAWREGLLSKEWVLFFLEHDPLMFLAFEGKLQRIINVALPKVFPI
jgi:hypothetical protein